MTQEEKAKAYDEALEGIRGYIKSLKNVHDGIWSAKDIENHLSKYFPELKESEDERIRKELIFFLGDMPEDTELRNGVTNRDVLAWLEKQVSPDMVADAYLRGCNDTEKKLLEKQGEQNHCMIQWKGDNLKEVIDFTGKDKNFEKWFKSFEEYEKYVQEHDGIFKLFNADGSHYEVPVGAWIVKTPDGYNVASKAIFRQKSVDTPKFKIGALVVFNNKHQSIYQVEKIEDGYYILRHTHGGTFRVCVLHDESLRLWTIEDAKDGDVLAAHECLVLFREIDGLNIRCYCTYHFMNNPSFHVETLHNKDAFHPATKEQRDQLGKVMVAAGFTFDFEKKELKKIEQNSVWSEEDEKRLESIIEECSFHKGRYKHGIEESAYYTLCEKNISWLKSLKDRGGCAIHFTTAKAWSEKDEATLDNIISDIRTLQSKSKCSPSDRYYAIFDEEIDWLKLLKDRVLPQNITYYNPYKEVVESIAEMCKHYNKASHSGLRDFYDNVKVKCKDAKEYDSLYPHNTWKPTKDQIDALFAAVYLKALRNTLEKDSVKQLEELYNQLKKLRDDKL